MSWPGPLVSMNKCEPETCPRKKFAPSYEKSASTFASDPVSVFRRKCMKLGVVITMSERLHCTLSEGLLWRDVSRLCVGEKNCEPSVACVAKLKSVNDQLPRPLSKSSQIS